MIGRNEDFRAAWPKHFVVHPTADIADNKYVSNDTGVNVALPSPSFLNIRQHQNGLISMV